MAKTVASLSVSINARTKGLRRGLRKARKQVGDFAKSVARAITSVAKLGAGLGLLAGGVAAVGTGKAMNSLDNLAKTAKRLKILPTPLVALRDAAKESGVDVKTLDMGLQRMLRRIQEAAKGRGEALPTLKELGLDASRLARMAPEKQFIAIAKAMNRMKDDGQDLSRAMKLFDSGGVGLVNTLRLVNEKGLEPFIQAAQRSGRAGTKFEAGLPNVERVKDSLSRLKDRVTGVFDQMAIAAAVPLNRLLAHLESFLNSSNVLPAFFEKMSKAGVDAAGWIDSFFVGRGKAGEFREELEKIWESLKEFMSEHFTVENLTKAFEDVVKGVKRANDVVQDFINLYHKLRDLIPGVFREAVSQQSDNMLGAASAINKARDFLNRPVGFPDGGGLSRMKETVNAIGQPGKQGSDEEKRQTKELERQTGLLDKILRKRDDRLMVLG